MSLILAGRTSTTKSFSPVLVRRTNSHREMSWEAPRLTPSKFTGCQYSAAAEYWACVRRTKTVSAVEAWPTPSSPPSTSEPCDGPAVRKISTNFGQTAREPSAGVPLPERTPPCFSWSVKLGPLLRRLRQRRSRGLAAHDKMTRTRCPMTLDGEPDGQRSQDFRRQ